MAIGYLIFFLVGLGAFLILFGSIILTKRRLGNYLRFERPTAVAVTALVIGSAALGAGLWITNAFWADTGTTTMY